MDAIITVLKHLDVEFGGDAEVCGVHLVLNTASLSGRVLQFDTRLYPPEIPLTL